MRPVSLTGPANQLEIEPTYASIRTAKDSHNSRTGEFSDRTSEKTADCSAGQADSKSDTSSSSGQACCEPSPGKEGDNDDRGVQKAAQSGRAMSGNAKRKHWLGYLPLFTAWLQTFRERLAGHPYGRRAAYLSESEGRGPGRTEGSGVIGGLYSGGPPIADRANEGSATIHFFEVGTVSSNGLSHFGTPDNPELENNSGHITLSAPPDLTSQEAYEAWIESSGFDYTMDTMVIGEEDPLIEHILAEFPQTFVIPTVKSRSYVRA